jgi:sugar fermentation stimulation protein A
LRFEETLLEGTLEERTKPFHARIRLRSGERVMAHCANPGSMQGCSDPGSRVLLSVHKNARRRHAHQMEIVYAGRVAIGVHSGRPTTVLVESIRQGKISEVAGYATLRREVQVPKVSCVDLVLEGNGLRTCKVVAKNVTLAQGNTAYYPDAVMEHAYAELTELTNLVREGSRAMIFLLAQRADVETLRPADAINPEYGQAFRDAIARGVEIACYRAKVTRKGIELDKRLPVDLAP